jgi:hypothetical protein
MTTKERIEKIRSMSAEHLETAGRMLIQPVSALIADAKAGRIPSHEIVVATFIYEALRSGDWKALDAMFDRILGETT